MGMYGSIASGLVSAVGTLHQTRAQQQAAEYEASQAAIQAKLTREEGEIAANDIRAQGRASEGKQIAATRGGGVTMAGTPLQVMADNAVATELSAQRTLYSYGVKAMGYDDVFAMRKYESKMLERNKFNIAGAAFVSSVMSSGGGGMMGGGGGSSLMS